MEAIENVLETIWSWVIYPLFTLGIKSVSFLTIVKLFLFIFLCFSSLHFPSKLRIVLDAARTQQRAAS